MKASKVWGYIALAIHILYFFLVITVLICLLAEPHQTTGVSRSFALWIYSIILSGICLIIHIVDSALAITAKSSVVAVIKLVLAIIMIPLFLLIAGTPATKNMIIWNAAFVVLFGVHVLSLFNR